MAAPDTFVIVGGGPTGLAAAIAACANGARAIVIERCGGPVDKACGEGLMPNAVARLAQMGVVPPAWGTHPFRGIRYIDATSGRRVCAEADFSQGPGLGVRRLALSEALRARAQALGVELWERTEATGFSADGSGVSVRTSSGTAHGQWLIAADGLHSQVRKWAGLKATVGPARRLGIRQHFTVQPWADHVEVWWSDRAEAYVTPVGPNRVGVAFLWRGRDQRGDMETFLKYFPELTGRLGPPESTIRGAGPFDVQVAGQQAGRVLLVGDAAGYVDALTGEGIALGLEQAEAAVALCLRNTPEAWSREWTALTRRHRLFTRLLLGVAARPYLRRMVIRGLAAVPAAFQLGLRVGSGGQRALPMAR